VPEPVALALPEKPSIAVLPFQNMSGDAEQEYFADGIAEDVITLLSKSRGLFVIARNSTFTYKGRAIDVKTVGRELGVRYVLEGSVRKAGGRVRVTAQLIEAATGGHLWAERYDRDLTDIFAVQDEITASVSAAILPTMERSERERAARKPPDGLNAWEYYHRGLWHFAKMEAAENDRARDCFGRAIGIDPGFAAAYAAISMTYITEVTQFRSSAMRPEIMPHAIEHARRSIAIDPSDVTGHCALSYALMISGRHDESLAEADIAVSRDPNSALAYAGQGSARAFGGMPQEAIQSFDLAIRLSPFDPHMPRWMTHLSRAHYLVGNYDTAVRLGRQVCSSYPNFRSVYWTLVPALGQTGQGLEAQAAFAEVRHRFGVDLRVAMSTVLTSNSELRPDDYALLLEGYHKAGVLD
jgi:TolB-like protein